MRYGICTDMEYAVGVKAAGFDYIELKTYDVALASREEFEHIKGRLHELELPCEAINFFYPPSLNVVGPELDEERVQAYIRTAIERAKLLGVQMITVGSSSSRRIPEGYPPEEAKDQFASQLRYAGKLAQDAGITIAIEPIRPSSTNFINTIQEAAELCRMVNLSNVRIMADYYQMRGAKDPISEVSRFRSLISHLHTIDIERKCYPYDPEDPGQRELFKVYTADDMGERVSIEGADFTTVQTAEKALAVLRSYYFAATNKEE